MRLYQEYVTDFPSDVRERGETYQRQKRVTLLDHSPSFVEAEVEGSDIYRSTVDVKEDGSVVYDCNCEYFSDKGPCKHLWAAILQAASQGILPKPLGERTTVVDTGDQDVSPGNDTDEEDLDDDDDAAGANPRFGGSRQNGNAPPPNGGQLSNGLRLAENGPAPVQRQGTGRPPVLYDRYGRQIDLHSFGPNRGQPARKNVKPEPLETAWKTQLTRLSEEMQGPVSIASRPLNWPAGRRLIYAIDVDATIDDGLTIVLLQESTKRDGGYDKPKALRLTQDQIAQLPDPLDRQVVQGLVGMGRTAFAGLYEQVIPESFTVDAWAYDELLRTICASGRCRTYSQEEGLRELTWDDGPPWEFMLELRPSPGGRYVNLEGVLRRPLRDDAQPVGPAPSSDTTPPDVANNPAVDAPTAVGDPAQVMAATAEDDQSYLASEAAAIGLNGDEVATELASAQIGLTRTVALADPVSAQTATAQMATADATPADATPADAALNGSADQPRTTGASNGRAVLQIKEPEAIRDDDDVADESTTADEKAEADDDADASDEEPALPVETPSPFEFTHRTVPLNDAMLLLNGDNGLGYVFIEGNIARLQHNDAFPILVALREGEKIAVPRDRQGEMLKLLLKFPRLPRLELPPELSITQLSPIPKPQIRVTGGKKGGKRDALPCQVSFDYGKVAIDFTDPRGALLIDDGQTLLRRDTQKEARHVAELVEAGVKIEANYWGKVQSVLLPASKLPKAVGDLTRRGWMVEAEGKLYRSAGQVNINVSSGIDWFELHGEVSFDGLTASLPKLLEALRKGESVVRLDDGTYGLLPEEWLKKYAGIAGMGEREGDTLKFNSRQIGFLDALLSSLPDASFDETFKGARDELMRFGGVQAIEAADTFIGTLRHYQKEGLGWMAFLRKFGFGGVLADDMGLGKTIQILALLEARRLERVSTSSSGSLGPNQSPSLVVAPRSLIFNWQSEAQKFAPGLRVLDHSAVDRKRSADHFEDYDLILTTYGTLRRDMSYFKDIVFDYAVLDEAQAIKNGSSESAKAARLVRAEHRLALSGTPVQNHLGELWSLFDYLNPGMMGSVGVFRDLSADAANRDATSRELLARSLRPFILRRTKEQVAQDLPQKQEQTIFCELEKDQRKLYDELKDHYRTNLLERVARDGMNKAKIMVLEALLRLRQAACHPGLIDKTRSGEPSAKLETLMDRLAELVDEGHKVLVFSQFTSLLAIVKDRLDKQNLIYEYLDGRTKDRQARVDRFQNDADCKLFLISLKAGGVGLNLTAAEYVFLLDPWWNPAVEAQAIDRAHRIGQTRRVFAYRLIAKETVEEKVLQLQQSKKDLADAIINADNSLIRSLSRDDLEMLLS